MYCSSDQEKKLKFETEGQEFTKKILAVGQNNFGNKIPLLNGGLKKESQ